MYTHRKTKHTTLDYVRTLVLAFWKGCSWNRAASRLRRKVESSEAQF